MVTRAVLAVLADAEGDLTSHELSTRVQERFPGYLKSRRHLKGIIKWLKAARWADWRSQGRGKPFGIYATPLGREQPLHGVPEARHLRLAKARAAEIMAAANGSSPGTSLEMPRS